MDRRYQIFDVFTRQPLAGNPLAVVLDGDGLETERMQAIAGEFNLSETAFILPAENPGHSAKLRIFNPSYEMPFAGHPTVGAAVCLAADRFGDVEHEQDAVIVLEENIGLVRCGVRLNHGYGFAEFDLPTMPKLVGDSPTKERIAAVLGLDAADIGFENHKPSVWSGGVPYQCIPLRDMSALAAISVDQAEMLAALDDISIYAYTRETEGHDHSFRARMFASPKSGIGEDPATGSAVAAFSGAIRYFDDLPDGEHVALMEQGYEMGRPSLIRLEMVVAGERLQTVRIGGDAIMVAEGVLRI